MGSHTVHVILNIIVLVFPCFLHQRNGRRDLAEQLKIEAEKFVSNNSSTEGITDMDGQTVELPSVSSDEQTPCESSRSSVQPVAVITPRVHGKQATQTQPDQASHVVQPSEQQADRHTEQAALNNNHNAQHGAVGETFEGTGTGRPFQLGDDEDSLL